MMPNVESLQLAHGNELAVLGNLNGHHTTSQTMSRQIQHGLSQLNDGESLNSEAYRLAASSADLERSGEADVASRLVCVVCREANPWMLSCIHTWGLAPVRTLPSPQSVPQSRPLWVRPTGVAPFLITRLGVGRKFDPYDRGHVETGGGNLLLGLCPANNCATFDAYRKPAEGLSRHAYHGEPGDHRPSSYGADDLSFLDEHKLLSDDTARRGRGSKTRPTDFDLGLGVVEKAALTATVPHLRRRERLEKHSESGYLFLRRWMRGAPNDRPAVPLVVRESFSIGRNGLPRRERPKPAPTRRGPRFLKKNLTPEGLSVRDLETALDRVGRRAQPLPDGENQPLAQIEHHLRGSGSSIGIQKAGKLDRIRQARSRVEDGANLRLDFWKAAGGIRTTRGYLWPHALAALAARYVGGWRAAEIDSALKWDAMLLKQRIYGCLRDDYGPTLRK